MKPIILSTSYYAEDGVRYVFLDGNCCHTLDDCYASLRQQLSLPGYFGNNLDALEEVLNDLEWIPEKQIKLIFLNGKNLLKNEEKRENFLDLFITASPERLEIFFLE